jgi:hypothetical protein
MVTDFCQLTVCSALFPGLVAHTWRSSRSSRRQLLLPVKLRSSLSGFPAEFELQADGVLAAFLNQGTTWQRKEMQLRGGLDAQKAIFSVVLATYQRGYGSRLRIFYPRQ